MADGVFIFRIIKDILDSRMTNTKNIVHIYTDGACKGNPGPGGWGAVLKYGESVKEITQLHQQYLNLAEQ